MRERGADGHGTGGHGGAAGVRTGATALASDTTDVLSRLEAALRQKEALLVAFSGGVDSSLIAAAALRALGPWDEATRRGALAVLADSETLARHELDGARRTATAIGIPLVELSYSEFDDPEWTKNDGMRCYHCKKDLATELKRLADRHGLASEQIVFGVTASDLGDWRPGIQATVEAGCWRPLVDLGIDKSMVRQLAKHLDLPVWDKPATPCLASRVQYGEEITREKLSRVEAAEAVLRDLGFRVFRVRHHEDLARVEVAAEEFGEAFAMRERIVTGIRATGYTYVTLDLAGFRSGSMNEALTAGTGTTNGSAAGALPRLRVIEG